MLPAEALCEIAALHDASGDVDYVTVGYSSYLISKVSSRPFPWVKS